MYKYHYDKQNDQWNIFKVIHGVELYVCSFTTLAEAQRFCKTENEVTVNYV